ncbi:MAG: hypothetical protein M1828_000960 [Chrysothrix sp. TS-e1954]|nr:MAG: hypothetical protein M1828_000960 [Chrysothrix sp. TS-e1954]
MSAAAVDSATAQMANTSLNEPTSTAEGASVGAGGDKPINAAQNEAVIKSAAEGRRLYIGNLAYATTEGELKEFFKEYLIETTSIPTNPRTTRPVGYAFVDVSAPSEAERAVNELNGKTILDRKVSVQLARKPEEAAAGDEIANGEGRKRQSSRGRGRGRGGRRGGRGGRSPREADGTTAADSTNVPGQVLPLTDSTNKNVEGIDAAAKGQKGAPRAPRQRGPPEDGVPSKNKVMVANLPYDLKEEKLMEIFGAFSPTGAKLALRPIPRFMVRKLLARGEPRKGRGFAFVTLETEEMQQKAIAEMNGKEIEGRELAVKVAIDSPGKEDEALEAQADAVEAKENGTPSTAEGSASVAPTTSA